MAPEQLSAISVIKPISPAIEKVKTILFKPFEIGKWFTIGFCAWLALLGQKGANFHANFPCNNFCRLGTPLGRVKNVFSEHFLLIVVLASFGLLIGLAVMITLLWLNSRGRFMFLYCVAENKAEVKMPWHNFRKPANSLWLFKLISGFIVFICLALCAAMITLTVILLTKSYGRIRAAEILAIVCLALVTALIAIASALFFKFTNDFVIPIMYLRPCSCTDAWHRFLQILSSRKGAFALYILFQIVISMVIVAILIALVFGTCCCAALFLVIPYVGTVLMLPLLVFKRAYSLYYLGQFGPDFNVFAPPATAQQPEQSR